MAPVPEPSGGASTVSIRTPVHMWTGRGGQGWTASGVIVDADEPVVRSSRHGDGKAALRTTETRRAARSVRAHAGGSGTLARDPPRRAGAARRRRRGALAHASTRRGAGRELWRARRLLGAPGGRRPRARARGRGRVAGCATRV